MYCATSGTMMGMPSMTELNVPEEEEGEIEDLDVKVKPLRGCTKTHLHFDDSPFLAGECTD